MKVKTRYKFFSRKMQEEIGLRTTERRELERRRHRDKKGKLGDDGDGPRIGIQ